jgi:EamA domain-containing membrane protein RarD
MSDPVKGAIAMALACTIWGLSPLFYALLSMSRRWRCWRTARSGRF